MSSLRPRIDTTPRDQRHCSHRLAKGRGSTQHSCIVAEHCSRCPRLVDRIGQLLQQTIAALPTFDTRLIAYPGAPFVGAGRRISRFPGTRAFPSDRIDIGATAKETPKQRDQSMSPYFFCKSSISSPTPYPKLWQVYPTAASRSRNARRSISGKLELVFNASSNIRTNASK